MAKNYHTNHFVSDFLIEGWKQDNKSRRGIWYYDFSDDQLKHDAAKAVFARRKVFSPDMERRYNKLIESPLSRFRDCLANQSNLENKDWEIQRALHLVFLAQGPRVSHAKSPTENSHFVELLEKDDNYLNHLVDLSMASSMITRVFARDGQSFFYPELGYFSVPMEDPDCVSNWSYALGLPIAPEVAIILSSNTVPLNSFKVSPICNFSVGLNENTNRVAIPPGVIEYLGELATIEAIKSLRQSNQQLVSSVGRIRELVKSAAAMTGLTLEKAQGDFYGKLKYA